MSHSESESTDDNTILSSEADSPRTITSLEDEPMQTNVISEEFYPIIHNFNILPFNHLLKVQESLYSDVASTCSLTSITSTTEDEANEDIICKVNVREAKRIYSSDNESCSTLRDSSDNEEAYVQNQQKNKVSDSTILPIHTNCQKNLSSTTSIFSKNNCMKYEYQQNKFQSCSRYRTVIDFSKSKFEIRNYFVPGEEDWKKLNISLYNLENTNEFNKIGGFREEVEQNLNVTNDLDKIDNFETFLSSGFSKTSNSLQFSSKILSSRKYFKPSEKDWKRLQWSVDDSNWNNDEGMVISSNNLVCMEFSARKRKYKLDNE
ncbi:5799_t:CDS:2 [Scutellospora calospora]|uniref:5799_t:CDS:1 n=1 Tax=Scutellospora calospora TaxID=85575 RepID=A0ACA9JZY0_9GLOM|nr:5799_t:CDS:2 [Scutellospora calospora]